MIRPVTMRDVPQITAIYNHYILNTTISFEVETVSANAMEQRLRRYATAGPCLVSVADDGETVLGYCYAHAWKERQAYCHTYETTIYLHPDHYGAGIGTALLQRLIAECKHYPIHALIACITGGNEASIRLHERCGFAQVSLFREVGYKFGRRLDVVDYELIIDNDDDNK